MRIVEGDVFEFAGEEGIILHGVTENAPAAAGFASQVNLNFVLKGEEHYGTPPGRVARVHPRVMALVTQREYGRAEPKLIVRAFEEAQTWLQAEERAFFPLVGGGLGGLFSSQALFSIVRAVGGDPRFTLCLLEDTL